MVDHGGDAAESSTHAGSTTPETVTEAVAFLASEGYVDDFSLSSEGLIVFGTETTHSIKSAIVDYTFRFEGPSDPADEAIVLGVSCPEWGRKGTVVSAYGPYADPEQAAMLAALAGTAQKR